MTPRRRYTGHRVSTPILDEPPELRRSGCYDALSVHAAGGLCRLSCSNYTSLSQLEKGAASCGPCAPTDDPRSNPAILLQTLAVASVCNDSLVR